VTGFLTYAEAALLLIGAPLVWLFLRERVKNVAREASDRALADYRHQHEQTLATLTAEHQRRLQEFSLYTQKQHRVYATLYARVRRAVDGYASLIGAHIGPDFQRFGLEDVRKYVEVNHVGAEEARPVLAAYANGPTPQAATLLSELDHRVRKANASAAFQQAKNTEALHELYLSDPVRAKMAAVRQAVAAVSADVEFPEPGRGVARLEKQRIAEAAMTDLYTTMRNELRRGT
jgi:hypothetical protein